MSEIDDRAEAMFYVWEWLHPGEIIERKRFTGQVFDREAIERCVVDGRPPACVEVEPGVWFYLPRIVQPEPQWRPYEPCKDKP